ncbi:MAG: O-antigen ligase family protein [Pirellulales bacterium]
MSTQSTSIPTAALPAPSRALGRGKVSIAGLSLTGVLLFVISLLVVGSGYLEFRPIVFGLSVHPYLVPVALAFPLVLLARVTEFPVRVLSALMVFAAMYSFSVLSGGGLSLGAAVKIFSGVLTIFTCALLVRRRGDFVAGALGLSIAIAILAMRGLEDPLDAGVDPVEGANKNSYSLFALPAMLMAGYIATRMKTVPVVIKWVLVACTLPALAAIFMSSNRSGYLGAVVVGFLLFWDRRGRGMLVVGAVTAAIVFWMSNFGSTKVFDERIRQTVEGTQSDELRIAILWSCAWIALENPIIGVSPDKLPFEIGRRTNVGHYSHINFLDAHNVYGHVAAGSGLICLAAMLAIGYTLWTLKPANGRKFAGKDDPARQALTMMRMMVLLWAIRGTFTHEILYNPACNIGLGLCLGLFIVAQAARPDPDAAEGKSSPTQLPQNGRASIPAA